MERRNRHSTQPSNEIYLQGHITYANADGERQSQIPTSLLSGVTETATGPNTMSEKEACTLRYLEKLTAYCIPQIVNSVCWG